MTVRVVFKRIEDDSLYLQDALRRFVLRWNMLYEDIEGVKMRAKWFDKVMLAFADVESEADAVLLKLKYQYFEVPL